MTISMIRRSAMVVMLGAAAAACTVGKGEPASDETGTTTSASADTGSSSESGPPPTACMEPHNEIVNGECRCEDGYDWCEPDDPNDYTCCGDSPPNPSTTNPSTETDASTSDADTTAGDTDGPTPPDPADCTEDTPDVMFCSNTAAMGPENSVYWVCTNGEWVDGADTADEQCQFDNYDFAYGCIDDGQTIAFICGNGSGAPCENDEAAMCIDADVIDTCIYGRSTEDSCATLCSTIGDERGVTYDTGFCDDIAMPPECFCCDDGDPGCPG